MRANAFPPEKLASILRSDDAGFTVRDQLLQWAADGEPEGIRGCHAWFFGPALMSTAARHLVHRSIMRKAMRLWAQSRSRSTCSLKMSAVSPLLALLGLAGPFAADFAGLADLLKHHQVFLRNPATCWCDLRHQRTCNFRNVSRIEPWRFARSRRTTRPMSMFVQVSGASGIFPA
jgi:hypothetical protein